jgi:hypothetical protein
MVGVEAELCASRSLEPADGIIEQYLSIRICGYQVDRVIAVKFPAYLLPHPVKVLRLLHLFAKPQIFMSPGVYLCHYASGARTIQVVQRRQAVFLECRTIYTNSPVTQVGYRNSTASAARSSIASARCRKI